MAKPILHLLYLMLLLLAVGIGREPDLTDECFLFYEAQAAWNTGGQDLGSSPATKLFGHILGLPFLLAPDAGLLVIRLFSLFLWMAAFSLLIWGLKETRSTLKAGLLPLFLILHTLHMPLLSYQSLPAVFLAALFGCWFHSARGRGPAIFTALAGALCGMLPLCHVPLLAPSLALIVWLCIQAPGARQRMILCAGFAVTFATFVLLWHIHHEQIADRNRWLANMFNVHQPLTSPGSELQGYVSRVEGSLQAYAPRLLNMVLMIGLCLGTGFAARTLLIRRLRNTTITRHLCFQLLQFLAAASFTGLWFLGHWQDRTLCGLFTLILLTALPILLHWLKTASVPTLGLRTLAVTAVCFGMCHSFSGSLNTTTYYPTFYMPLIWIPLTLSIIRLPKTKATHQLFVHTAGLLIALNLLIVLTHGHRAAAVLDGPRVQASHAPFHGLWFTAERDQLIRNTLERFNEVPSSAQCLIGLHHLSYPYVLLHQPAPWGNAWFHTSHPGLVLQVGHRAQPELFLLASEERRPVLARPHVSELCGPAANVEPLGDGVLLGRSSRLEVSPAEDR